MEGETPAPKRATRCLSQYDDRTGECTCDFCRQERYDEYLEWLDEQEEESFPESNDWEDDLAMDSGDQPLGPPAANGQN